MMLKRIFSFILVIIFACMQAYALAAAQKRPICKKQQVSSKKSYAKKKNAPKSSLVMQKNEKIEPDEPEFYIPPVLDSAAEELSGKGLKKNVYTEKLIEDDAAGLVLNAAASKYQCDTVIEHDELPVCDFCVDVKPEFAPVQASENELLVYLKPVKKITTKCKRIKVAHDGKNKKFSIPFPLIGETVEFKVLNDVFDGEKVLIHKNTAVYAMVGEVSPRAMGGVPAEMTIEKFYMQDKNGKNVELSGEINSSGYTLAVWIGLVELATTPFLFGFAAPVLRFLPGGQAVVTPRKKYAVYYRK